MRKVCLWCCVVFILGLLTVGAAAEGTVGIVPEKTIVYEGESFTAEIVLENTPLTTSLAFSDFVFTSDFAELIGAEWLITDGVIADVDLENNAAAIAYEDATDMNGSVLRLEIKVGEVDKNTFCEIGCLAVMEIDGVRTEIEVIVGNVEIVDYIRGDTNGDGVVASADAVYLLRHTLLPERYPLNGVWFDYNNNGNVDGSDAVYLLYHAMLPEKYPLEEVMREDADTGFVIPPYITGDAVYFKTEEDGEVWYYFSKDGSAVASSEFEEYYDDVSISYLYGQLDVTGVKLNYFEIDENVDFDEYPFLVIAFLHEDTDGDTVFLNPVIVNLSDHTSTEDDDDDSTTSKTGLSITDVDPGNHIITVKAAYDGEVTVSLYVDGKSATTIGSINVSEDEIIEFDYSAQSAGIKLLAGAGSDVEIVFQLVNDDETYRKVKVQVFE